MIESKMEELLIKQLTHGVSQWTYRPDLRTEEALWNNLREKLNRNNIDKLQGIPLTEGEMRQIKQFLLDQAATTYKAARWLSGEHQVAQIPLHREDASLGEVSLMAVNSREIAGGNSSYEVINQFQAVKGEVSKRNRRFDVTLLINGLPLIHIELKNRDHPFMDAFRQITKYCEEGKFRGLMGLVQMFVVSNGEQTRYIAADNHGNMNEKFLMRWVNEENEPVEDYLAFAKAALNIPAAHLMVGKYCVLDNDRKKVILLRPYQIHAIEAIRKASRNRESGFVWHTTGSGKTLTSYTVTKNLLDVPSMDKAIFLIDRKDLDQQTADSFLSYADSDDVDVRNTENTSDLEDKLKNKDRCAIVTTIQKLQNIIRRCTDTDATPKYLKLKDQISKKTIAFIVDECHRAVTPESKRVIEKFFHRSLWYGFTGTPIFEENKRA
ncbi:DEAD/DEAH box helicase family protein, partial [Sutterella wadsworthensis]